MRPAMTHQGDHLLSFNHQCESSVCTVLSPNVWGNLETRFGRTVRAFLPKTNRKIVHFIHSFVDNWCKSHRVAPQEIPIGTIFHNFVGYFPVGNAQNDHFSTVSVLCIKLWIDWITDHALTGDRCHSYIHQQPFSGPSGPSLWRISK